MTKTLLMGILNITPDSFYETSRALAYDDAIARALQLQAEGADILDIGGESSRPGALSVSEEEEVERVIPVIEALKNKLSIPISIDTIKPKVARQALKHGATLLNDITGFTSPDMVALAREANCDLCVMHMLGNPQTMQLNPHYEDGIISFLLTWFEKRTNMLMNHGIDSKKIIIDPGIGFGKTVEDNLKIIHNLSRFKELGFRVLIGVSRKTFLRKILNKSSSEELLPGTLAINTLAIAAGVDIIRVHDVKEHRDVIDLMTEYKRE